MSRTTNNKLRIHITHTEVPKRALEIFGDQYELTFSKGLPFPSRETLLRDVKGAHAVLWFGHVEVDEEMIDAIGPQLKVVGVMSTGYDHIHHEVLKRRGIPVSHAPNVLSSAVADMAVGLALAISRNLVLGNQAIVQDKWVVNHPTWMCGQALEGSTVGIVGMGAIGYKIAQRISSFDIGQLLYTNQFESKEASSLGGKYVTEDELLAKSDFVFLMIPLLPQTVNYFNLEKFKKMKRTSIFINNCRGGVVNQDDLVKALQEKVIAGAALDVMTPEPLPHDHPLTKLSNVVLTPHISSATLNAREAMAKLAALNIWNILNGKELVTPIK